MEHGPGARWRGDVWLRDVVHPRLRPGNAAISRATLPRITANSAPDEPPVTLRFRPLGDSEAAPAEVASVFFRTKNNLLQWVMEDRDGIKFAMVFRWKK